MNEHIIQNVNEILQEEKRKKRGLRWPGLALTLTLAPVLLLFYYNLIRLKLLPLPILLAAGLFLSLIILLVYLLSRDVFRTGRCIFALILTILFGAVGTIGSLAGSRINRVVGSIFQPTLTETVVMNLYVRQDDPAQSIFDIKDETIALLGYIDRPEANAALEELTVSLGHMPAITEYPSPLSLIHALQQGNERVILLNESYLDLVADMPAYANLPPMKALARHEIHSVVEAQTATEPTGTSPAEPADQRPADTSLYSDGNAFALYISGIDSRRGLVSRSLSDVNILAVVNPRTHQIALISTPRDYYVKTPVSGGEKDKLTHAGLYGVDVSRGTLEMLYDMKIDYVFRLDFGGFIRIIDALGGVDVVSETDFSAGGYHFIKGSNHLDGEAALAFARERKAMGGADSNRGDHQMDVIRAVLKKISSPVVLARFNHLLDSLEGAFETTMPYDLLASLVQEQFSFGGEWNVISYNVLGTDLNGYPSFSFPTPNWICLPNEENIKTAKQLMWDVYYKESVTAP